jgi:hypothetical protein
MGEPQIPLDGVLRSTIVRPRALAVAKERPLVARAVVRGVSRVSAREVRGAHVSPGWSAHLSGEVSPLEDLRTGEMAGIVIR